MPTDCSTPASAQMGQMQIPSLISRDACDTAMPALRMCSRMAHLRHQSRQPPRAIRQDPHFVIVRVTLPAIFNSHGRKREAAIAGGFADCTSHQQAALMQKILCTSTY